VSGYDAVIDKIVETGRAAGRVASGVREVDPTRALPDGDAGIPGAHALAKLAAVKQGWQGKGQAVAGQLDEHSANIARAAEWYQGHEDAARHDMTLAAKPSGGARPV
jgi:hypothetical protein